MKCGVLQSKVVQASLINALEYLWEPVMGLAELFEEGHNPFVNLIYEEDVSVSH